MSLRDYVRLKGADWLSLAGLRLLSRLNELHKQGWIFGDLKADNVLVSGYGEAELVDYGGVTAKGRAVRQFTEIHDRAYWHAGSRTSDEGYDLFAFAVLCLQLAAPDAACFSSRMLPQNRSVEVLLEEVRLQPACSPYRDFLRKALLGQFPSSELARQAWKDAVYGIKEKPAGVARSSRWLHAGFAASLGIGLWAFYLYLT
ncbi:hypothetical protein N6H14_11540 [Paenibacillus sp. CC-CFT747]|nr:hypothetical protein N6H14_11540 [Paenibacillus sp. CC-CFT747]